LADVTAGREESFDSLLKRFNRKVQQDGILADLRRREHYEKPSIERKRKKAAKKRGAASGSRVLSRANTR
jgi:small subunit ribosomal protein S21